MTNTNPVLGIIGGGQLGSMLAAAAKKLKIKTIILTDDPKTSAKNFCDEIIITNYNNLKKLMILLVKSILLLLSLKIYLLKFLTYINTQTCLSQTIY